MATTDSLGNVVFIDDDEALDIARRLASRWGGVLERLEG